MAIIKHYDPDILWLTEGEYILCGACVMDWQTKTHQGVYKEADEVFSFDKILSKAETPAQCDVCNKQSEDYDSVLDED